MRERRHTRSHTQSASETTPTRPAHATLEHAGDNTLIGFFIPIAEALVVGYLATSIAYMVALLLLTRLGRRLLMSGDCVSTTYILLNALAWFFVAAFGAYACCHFSPLAPYGTILCPVVVAVLTSLVVNRTARQLPGQQSLSALIGNYAMIAIGTIVALFAHHALPFVAPPS